MLHVADSVNVAIGEPHRISNAGDERLVIIEVQHGIYTGEDDICRLDDDYGRADDDYGRADDDYGRAEVS